MSKLICLIMQQNQIFIFFLVSMESIAKYFESSKKRYLSDGSKTSEEPKKTLKKPLLFHV